MSINKALDLFVTRTEQLYTHFSMIYEKVENVECNRDQLTEETIHKCNKDYKSTLCEFIELAHFARKIFQQNITSLDFNKFQTKIKEDIPILSGVLEQRRLNHKIQSQETFLETTLSDSDYDDQRAKKSTSSSYSTNFESKSYSISISSEEEKEKGKVRISMLRTLGHEIEKILANLSNKKIEQIPSSNINNSFTNHDEHTSFLYTSELAVSSDFNQFQTKEDIPTLSDALGRSALNGQIESEETFSGIRSFESKSYGVWIISEEGKEKIKECIWMIRTLGYEIERMLANLSNKKIEQIPSSNIKTRPRNDDHATFLYSPV